MPDPWTPGLYEGHKVRAVPSFHEKIGVMLFFFTINLLANRERAPGDLRPAAEDWSFPSIAPRDGRL